MNTNNKKLCIVLIIIILGLLLAGQYAILGIIFVLIIISTSRYRKNIRKKYFYPLIRALSLLDYNETINDNDLKKMLCNNLLEANKFWRDNFHTNEEYQEFYKLFSKAWENIYIYTIINNLIDTKYKLESIKSELDSLNIMLGENCFKLDFDTLQNVFIVHNIYELCIFDKLSKEKIIAWCIQNRINKNQQVAYPGIANKFLFFEDLQKIDNNDVFYFYKNCCIDIIVLYLLNDLLLNKIICGKT